MIKAVVFDLDDTLISELDYIRSGYHHVAKELATKYDLVVSDVFNKMLSLFNNSSLNVFDRLLNTLEIPYSEHEISELVMSYRNHTPILNYYDDVLPTLDELKKRGIKTGIITDGYAITQQKKLEVLSASIYFDFIIVTDELGREFWKPHPKPFELMKDNLKINFNEMVYIGDNPAKDFYIRSTYSIKTIRIMRENGIHQKNEYLKGIHENFKVNDLASIIQFL